MNITLKNKIKNRPTQIKNIKIGLTNKFSLKVTEKLHNDFKKFSGDNSPIHSNFKFCKENNYKKKLGYAFLITSALSKIFGVYFPGGNELCLHQSCNFKNPFFIYCESFCIIFFFIIFLFSLIIFYSNLALE